MKNQRFRVCTVAELSPGERKIVEINGKTIGVFNVHGEYYALRNICPHQFAPLCRGNVTGYNAPSEVGIYNWCREGEIIRCPWHGWEFDIKTGRSIFNPHRVKTKSYPVVVSQEACETADEEDPSVETYPVAVDADVVYVVL
jgi:3-phenylpropionate/trans-cinnamate dioxygenase ferredoxin subunit